MKKQLKPAGKKGFGSAGKKDEIIDLENMVPQSYTDQDQTEEDVLDLTNKISPNEQESQEAGIIELTEKIQPPPSTSDKKGEQAAVSPDNVIRLSDMASNLSSEDIDAFEELSQDDIMDFDDENLDGADDGDLEKLTKQLESAISDSYEADEDESIERLPEANIIEIDDEDDQGLAGDDLLPEAEPGMADNIDAFDLQGMDDETTFAEFGKDLEDKIKGFSDTDDEMDEIIDDDDEDEIHETDGMDEDVSETALELNRAMKADLANIDSEGDEDLSDEIESIRNKLDAVFPEEGGVDALTIFDTQGQQDQDEDDLEEFDPNELVLPPFDENESGAPIEPFGNIPFEGKEVSLEREVDQEPESREAGVATAFDGNINLYNTQKAPSTNKAQLSDSELIVTNQELESALQNLIETKFGKRIEQLVVKAIENAVAREISKIKRAILDGSASLDEP